MKTLKWSCLLAVALWALSGSGCGSDEDGDTGGDGDTDSDTDTDGDTDGDSEVVCGGEGEPCCEDGDACTEGLDDVVSDYDQSCTCMTPCTFTACEAGDEAGYCANTLGGDDIVCVNDLDMPPVMSIPANDCTVGEACTADSGATDGTCLEIPDPTTMGATTLIRCLVPCETPPTGCEDTMVCTPALLNIDMTAGTLTVDYTDGHCIPNAK